MNIWVDADACPRVIKEILFRAAERVGVKLTLVANKPMRVPRSPHIEAALVPAGFDEADEFIVDVIAPGDLVITADIPLAAEVIEKGGYALNPRGELYTEENIRERLAVRNLLSDLRSGGIEIGGPAPFGNVERKAFADALDRFLAKMNRG